ncbi:hypothetical protein ACGFX4_34795 [Kitasatospora sp. NPDC048365]|uniref:hypothetical protein n=1 Tax=Kitasatospora sp. NPDC048365 TaxID=3364050 RepID=UPI003716D9E9
MAYGVFPLSFEVRAEDGSWTVDAAPVGIAEAVDLLVAAAGPQAVVTDLATVSFLDEDLRQWDASRIAAEQGIGHPVVHRLGDWAAGTTVLGTELLVLDSTALPLLLDGSWSPYQLGLLDLPAVPTPDRLDELALTLGTAVFDRPVLPALADSRLYATSHDDRFLAVETTDPALPAALFARLLALTAGSALVEAAQADLPAADVARTAIGRPVLGGTAVAWPGSGTSVVVPEPPAELVAGLIDRHPRWYATVAGCGRTEVTLDLVAVDRPRRPGEAAPTGPRLRVVLDLGAEAPGWSVRP